MIRVLFFIFLFPLLIVLLWDDAPKWAIWAGWAIVAGVVALMYLQGNLVLKCPNCGKRVKLGYTTCHHCGAYVGKPSKITTPQITAPQHDPMTVRKECEACKELIRPDATVCPHCRTQQAEVWSLRDGVWWDKDATGATVWYDQGSHNWVKARASDSSHNLV